MISVGSDIEWPTLIVRDEYGPADVVDLGVVHEVSEPNGTVIVHLTHPNGTTEVIHNEVEVMEIIMEHSIKQLTKLIEAKERILADAKMEQNEREARRQDLEARTLKVVQEIEDYKHAIRVLEG